MTQQTNNNVLNTLSGYSDESLVKKCDLFKAIDDFTKRWDGKIVDPIEIRSLIRKMPSTQATIMHSEQSMQQEPVENNLNLHMVSPDYRLIGCAICGSHDVGSTSRVAYCHKCGQTFKSDSFEETIQGWNNLQLSRISAYMKVQP
ncbi:MAG: hypothetical protein WC009_11355 [Methylotenera sp.]